MSIIEQNDNFCGAPWLTIHVEPNGSASPCCISTSNHPDNATYGNLHKESFRDIMQGEKLKSFRRQFMTNKQPSVCDACWRQEKLHGKHSSLRNNFNKNRFKEEYYLDTLVDGTYDKMKITYWDFRPSNRCNLACLMCWEGLSSGYYQLQKDLGLHVSTEKKFLEISNERFDEIFEVMKENLRTHSHETHFYFAGGEPLQIPQHHKILQHLIDNEYYDVSLRYNTNLTTLKYKSTNWAEVWSRFNNVVIDASVDAVGLAGEFQRMNSKWQDVKNNIQLLIDHDVKVTFNMVMTMITYPYIVDTINEISAMFDDEYLSRHPIANGEKIMRFIGTDHPDHLCLNNTPKEYIDYSLLDKVDELGYDTKNLRGLLTEFESFNSDDNSVKARWRRLKKLDTKLKQFKGIGFGDVLPWFDSYVEGNDFI